MSETAVETPATTDEVEAKPKREKKVVEPTPCASSLYHWVDDEGVKHDCGTQGSVTPRTFRPGHDAKLKSLLIKAAVAGKQVVKTTPEDGEVEMDPLHAAEEYGFRGLVEKSVESARAKQEARDAKAKEREEAKAKREAEKAKAKAAREAKVAQKKAHAEAVEKAAEDAKSKPGPATAKVGRQKFDGEVLNDGTFKYKNAKGEDVETTEYTVVIDPNTVPVPEVNVEA
jgi:hypothetical protein